jgi:predicted Zn-dependent protease
VYVRIVSAVAALVVAAWFALGIRQTHELNTVTSILSGHPTLGVAQVKRADGLLDSAGTLNPDGQVSLLRGEVSLAAGRTADAQRTILQVTRDEPLNVDAWAALARTAGSNHRLILLALGNIGKLVPKVPSR